MKFATIEVAVEGYFGSIELNRPSKLNALGSTTIEELELVAHWFDEQSNVKVVTLSGKGRSFSAGADLAGFDPSTVALGTERREGVDAGRRMVQAFEAMQAVTVARIQGHCVGAAVVLVSACDFRVAADTAVFSIPELQLGIPLAWAGIPRLVRELGPTLTKELVMTCRPLGAREAQAIGFLNRVVPAGELDAVVRELVRKLGSRPSLALRATKRHVNAIAEGITATARSWNDADSLVVALSDPEGQAVRSAYLDRMKSR